METYGYTGKILNVDLTSRKITEEALDIELAKKFIGDFGVGLRMAYDLIKPGIDPLSPDNVIIIGAGPLAGTSAPAAAKCDAITKFPITNTVGESGGSMGFSGKLKYAGYDQLIITGRADKPVYLRISDEAVEISDASELWGKDIYQATDEIWGRHGRTYGVICIGPAGENLVKISMAMIDKTATMGKRGLGAVMGSKNLKAIAADGKIGVKVSDRKRFRKLVSELMTDAKNWPIREEFVKIGHLEWDIRAACRIGLGFSNYHTVPFDPDEMERRYGPKEYLEKAKKLRVGCLSCPIACRDVYELKEGPYKGLRSYGHSIDTYGGPRFNLKDISELVAWRDPLQRFGIDVGDFGESAELLIDLSKRGVIAKGDLEGLEANFESTMKLMDKVVSRVGIGDVVADGIPGIIKAFGKECEQYAEHIKGAGIFADPRNSELGCMQFDEVVNPAGHATGKGGMINPGKFDPSTGVESFKNFANKMAISEEAQDRIFAPPFKVNIARLDRHTEDIYAVLSCLGLCGRNHINWLYPMARLAELYSAATGIEISPDEIKRAGERSYNVLKVLNVREGFSRKDDRRPPKWLQPLKTKDGERRLMDYFKTTVLTAEVWERLLDDYYDERGWDIKTGCPTKETLEDLDLGDIAENLQKLGYL